jgi:hypothetical protein
MKTAFETACDTYRLRKEVEHRARLRALKLEMTRGPFASLSGPAPAPAPVAAFPRRSRG